MNSVPPLVPAQAGTQYCTETGRYARFRGHERRVWRVLTASVGVGR